MNKDDTICLPGLEVVETGNYTKKEYLEAMNKHFKKRCSVYIKSLQCKSCKKYKEMNHKEIYKQLNKLKKNKTYKMTKNTEKKLVKQWNKCNRCENKNTKKCNFENYLLYSGAELGKCQK